MSAPLTAYSADDLLQAWRSTVPQGLLDQLDDSGWVRIFEAIAAGALSSGAAVRLVFGQYAHLATIGQHATGTIRISRSTAGAAGTLLAGATFQASILVRVVTTAQATIPVSGTVDVAVRALLRGRAGNLSAGIALAFEEGSFGGGSDLGGVLSAAVLAPGLSGGQDAQLEAIGQDRGVQRQDGESEDLFRDRVRYLPDTVSPAAIARQVRRVLRRLTGVAHPVVVLVEHWEEGIAGDIDPADEETGPEPKGNPPGSLRPFSRADSEKWFTVCIDPLTETADGLACDVGPCDVLPCDVTCPTAQQGYQIVHEAIRLACPAGTGFYLARIQDWPYDAWGYGDDPVYGWRYDYDEGEAFPEEIP